MNEAPGIECPAIPHEAAPRPTQSHSLRLWPLCRTSPDVISSCRYSCMMSPCPPLDRPVLLLFAHSPAIPRARTEPDASSMCKTHLQTEFLHELPAVWDGEGTPLRVTRRSLEEPRAKQGPLCPLGRPSVHTGVSLSLWNPPCLSLCRDQPPKTSGSKMQVILR